MEIGGHDDIMALAFDPFIFFDQLPMIHLTTSVYSLTTRVKAELVCVNILFGAFLLSGMLGCSSTKEPASMTQHQSEGVASDDVIDWRNAESDRMKSMGDSKLKHHRVIDWMAHERRRRSQENQLVEGHTSIDWQKLKDSAGNEERQTDELEQNDDQPKKGSDLALRAETGSTSESDRSSVGEHRSRSDEEENLNRSDGQNTQDASVDIKPSGTQQVSVQDNEEASDSSLNETNPERENSMDRNRSAVEKQAHDPAGQERGTRIDWVNAKKQQNSSGGPKASQTTQNGAGTDKRKGPESSESEIKTIYLDQIDWRKVSGN